MLSVLVADIIILCGKHTGHRLVFIYFFVTSFMLLPLSEFSLLDIFLIVLERGVLGGNHKTLSMVQ